MLRKDKTHTKETKKEKQGKTKGRLQVSTKIIENNNLYDAWTISTHDACSNAVRMSSIWLWNYKIGLSIEFIYIYIYNKIKNQNLKTHFQKSQQNDQLIITQDS